MKSLSSPRPLEDTESLDKLEKLEKLLKGSRFPKNLINGIDHDSSTGTGGSNSQFVMFFIDYKSDKDYKFGDISMCEELEKTVKPKLRIFNMDDEAGQEGSEHEEVDLDFIEGMNEREIIYSVLFGIIDLSAGVNGDYNNGSNGKREGTYEIIPEYEELLQNALNSDGLNSEKKNYKLADLLTAIIICKEGNYISDLMLETESLLIKLCVERFCLYKVEKSIASQNLLALSSQLDIIEKFNLVDVNDPDMIKARHNLNKLENELEKESEKERDTHNKEFQDVIRELNFNFFGTDFATLKSDITNVFEEFDKNSDKIAHLRKEFNEIMSSKSNSNNKISQLDNIYSQLRKFDIVSLKNELALVNKEKFSKLQQNAQLKTQITSLESEKKELKLKNDRILDDLESVRKEKDDVKKKTLQFAATFMKEEYKTKLSNAMKSQEEFFKQETEKLKDDVENAKKNSEAKIQQMNLFYEEEKRTLILNWQKCENDIKNKEAENEALKREVEFLQKKLKSEEKLRQYFGGGGQVQAPDLTDVHSVTSSTLSASENKAKAKTFLWKRY